MEGMLSMGPTPPILYINLPWELLKTNIAVRSQTLQKKAVFVPQGKKRTQPKAEAIHEG